MHVICLAQYAATYTLGWAADSVHPRGNEQGLSSFCNPRPEDIMWEIRGPLSYTGRADVVKVAEKNGPVVTFKLGGEFSSGRSVTLRAHAHTWYVIE